jgi:hypothetical protein
MSTSYEALLTHNAVALYVRMSSWRRRIIQDKLRNTWFLPNFWGFALFQTLHVKRDIIIFFYIALCQIRIKWDRTVYVFLTACILVLYFSFHPMNLTEVYKIICKQCNKYNAHKTVRYRTLGVWCGRYYKVRGVMELKWTRMLTKIFTGLKKAKFLSLCFNYSEIIISL